MCSQNAKNVKDMMRIFRPRILLLYFPEYNDDVLEIFMMLREELDQRVPLLVITTMELRREIETVTEHFKRCMLMFRPVNGTDVLRNCYRLLNLQMTSLRANRSQNRYCKRKVLVIDDSALVLREIKSLLEDDYEILLARSGEQGLNFMRTKEPDLVLLDYYMPGMDGLETFEKIKEDESIRDIPVVFLTSVAKRNPIIAVLKNLPHAYILKPPSKEKLIQVIREALGEDELE